MATSLTFGPPLTQFSAAPRPRPPRGLPQPIRPTRMVSSPPAWTCGTVLRYVAAAAAAAAEVLRNVRRVVLSEGAGGVAGVMDRSPGEGLVGWGFTGARLNL